MTKKKKDEATIEAPPEDNSAKLVAELTDHLQRLQAEFDNYRKQKDKDVDRCITFANAQLVGKLLVIIDSFEQALRHADNKEEFAAGMKMIHAELVKILEKEGLRPIEAKDRQFDPYKHEVLLTELSDRDGTVLDELQKGYMFKDKILRYSKVKVGKYHVNNKDNKEGNDTQARN